MIATSIQQMICHKYYWEKIHFWWQLSSITLTTFWKNANYSRIVIGNDRNKKEFKNVNRHYNCYWDMQIYRKNAFNCKHLSGQITQKLMFQKRFEMRRKKHVRLWTLSICTICNKFFHSNREMHGDASLSNKLILS